MKRFLLISSALILAMPGVAQAQSQPQHRPPTTKPGKPGKPAHPGKPGARPPGNQRPPAARPPQHRPPTARPPGNQRPPATRPPGNQRPPQHRPPIARPPVHRPGAGRPPNFRPIQRPPFRYPHGYHYRRWHTGLILPHLFLTSPYFFNDWGPLGVGAPPPGYRWVRYGPDLLLVQLGTGRIADTIYGAFY